MPPAPALAGITAFRAPSGKISCGYVDFPDQGKPFVRCDLLFLKDRAAIVGTSGHGRISHVTDAVGSPRARVLSYGASRSFGLFTCTSKSSGLTCRNRRTGHGFTVSRQRRRVF